MPLFGNKIKDYVKNPGISAGVLENSRRMLEQYRDDVIQCVRCPNKNGLCVSCVVGKRIESFEEKAGITPAEL